MRPDLRKRKPSRKRTRSRIIRNTDCPDEDEEHDALTGPGDEAKAPATVQGKPDDQ
jgi:hypothetical protein